jgi:plasmid replication initiation protein
MDNIPEIQINKIEKAARCYDFIQPNQITFARYNYTALQKNIIYDALEAFQDEMTAKNPMDKEICKKETFVVSIRVDKHVKDNNYTKLLDSVKGLMKNQFNYEYEEKVEGKKPIKHVGTTVLVADVEHAEGSKTIELTFINKMVAVLLYIGAGFTPFQKTIAISLKSKHSKRLYEICCSWKVKGGFNMSLEEFREKMGLKKEYTKLSMFKEYVLEVAKEELKTSADVWFEYSLEKIRSRSYNWIYFSIFSNDPKQRNAEKGVYPNVYNFLTMTFPNLFSNKAMVITDELEKKELLSRAWAKFRPVYDRYSNNELEIKHLGNLTRKILTEDFLINVD